MIYTLGTNSGRKQLGLSVVTAIVGALKIGTILDWRPDPGRLTPEGRKV